MKLKNTFLYLLLGAILLLILGYFFSPSYTLSSQAKKEFTKGNYQESYQLATLALKEDPYNRSAFSIANQSKQRLNLQRFLQKTQDYYKKVSKLLQSPSITPQELLETQWIYDAFSKEYTTLYFFNKPTPDEKEAIENYAQWFKQLKEKIDLAKKQSSLNKS